MHTLSVHRVRPLQLREESRPKHVTLIRPVEEIMAEHHVKDLQRSLLHWPTHGFE